MRDARVRNTDAILRTERDRGGRWHWRLDLPSTGSERYTASSRSFATESDATDDAIKAAKRLGYDTLVF